MPIFKSVLCTKARFQVVFTITVHDFYIPVVVQEVKMKFDPAPIIRPTILWPVCDRIMRSNVFHFLWACFKFGYTIMRQRGHLFIFYDDDLQRHFAVVVVYHLRGVLAKICAVTSSGAICAKISRLDCYLIAEKGGRYRLLSRLLYWAHSLLPYTN